MRHGIHIHNPKTLFNRWVGILKIPFCIAAFSLFFGAAPAHAQIYVDADAAGGGDGTSWATAYNTLQDALAEAEDGDQIWVAEGIYFPDEGGSETNDDRFATFQLISGVEIYGGFTGDGTEDELSDRDVDSNLTILSGDIDGNDDPFEADVDSDSNAGTPTQTDHLVGDNSLHVVQGGGTNATAVLDGFTVTAGKADGGDGGGIYIASGNPTLRNLIISGNRAGNNGGGMYNTLENPALTNIIFSDNTALEDGGGMYNSTGSPTLTNVTFSDNMADDGGGIANSNGSPVLTNVVFSNNRATRTGGGLYTFLSSSNAILTNVVFTGNRAGHSGGGITLTDGDAILTNGSFYNNSCDNSAHGGAINIVVSSPILQNLIIWDNQSGGNSTTSVASISKDISNPVISNSLIANSGGSGSWNLDFGTDGGNNIDSDPIFLDPSDPDGADDLFGTDDDGLTLLFISPAINAGDNTRFESGGVAKDVNTDLAGNDRIFNTTVDMGAYEFQGDPPSLTPNGNVLYVDQSDSGGDQSGDSWANAYPGLTVPLSWAAGNWDGDSDGPLQIWVAEGTYMPYQLFDTDQDRYYAVPADVMLLGGFEGDETSADERNWANYPTILSGDLNSGGSANAGDSHTILNILGNDVVVDGFIFEHAYADGSSQQTRGGAVVNSGDGVRLSNSILRNNQAVGDGSSGIGGGLLNYGDITLVNNLFVDNTSTDRGGAIFHLSGDAEVINNTIAGNSGSDIGGIFLLGGTLGITNSIFDDNGENLSDESGITISHSLLDAALPLNVTDGGDNQESADPLFTDAGNGDYTLTNSSPALNVGDNTPFESGGVAENITRDLAGNVRIFDDDTDIVDMGAYEFQGDGGISGSPSVVIDGNAGWRMMGVPITGVSIATLAGINLVQGISGLPQAVGDPNFYLWDFDESSPDYPDYNGSYVTPANGSTELQPGIGFIWYMWGPEANPDLPESKTFPLTIELTGDEPAGDISLGTLAADWHLIANPFIEDVNFNQITDGTDPLGIAGSVWDPNEGEEGSYVLTTSVDMDDKLSVWQGAFIELSAQTEVVIPQSAKTSGASFLKQQDQPLAGQVEFTLEGLDDNGTVRTRDRAAILYFSEHAAPEWDGYDVHKLTPLSESWATVNLVGNRDGEPVLKSQHSLPYDFTGTEEIPVHIEHQKGPAEFTLSWPVVNNLPQVELWLVDRQTGKRYDLRQPGHIDFTMQSSDKEKSVSGVDSPLRLPQIEPMRYKRNSESRFMILVNPEELPDELPSQVALNQNYPNPFNPTTVISYQLPVNSEVRLEVYDMIGRHVTTLIEGQVAAGTHSVNFDASGLSSGIYLYRLQAGRQVMTRKLTVVK